MGLIIGPEVSKRKDLPHPACGGREPPALHMFPMRNEPLSGTDGKYPLDA
jgi:hypothetical protein